MNDTFELIFLFLAWMLLDIIGLVTFIKRISNLRDTKFTIKLKSLLSRKYSLISIITEAIGFILLIVSFYIPWYYHLFGIIGGGIQIQFLYFIDAFNFNAIFLVFIYYAYLLGLILIFVKISMKKKIHILVFLELIEIIFIIPGIILIFCPKFKLTGFWLAIFVYLYSGYTTGFVLYTIRFSVLIINGLQISIYLRLKRKKNQANNI